MMRYVFVTSCFVFLLGQLNAQYSQVKSLCDRMIELETEIDFKQTPGLIIGIMEGDSTYILPYGTLEKGQDIPPTAETFFELGSSSKLVTALATLIVLEKNGIQSNERFNNYVPEEFLFQSTRDITISDVLMHRTGLSKRPSNLGVFARQTRQPYKGYSDAALSQYIQKTNLDHDGDYSFSHTDYAMIAQLLKSQTGFEMKEIIDDMSGELFTRYNFPITIGEDKQIIGKMNRPGITTTDDVVDTELTIGYDRLGNQTPAWETGVFEASVGLAATTQGMLDMLRWMDQNQDNQAVKTMLDKTIETEMKGLKAAHAWLMRKPSKKFGSIYFHNGQTNGHQVTIAYAPQTRTAIVVFANSTHSLNGLGMTILQMLNFNWNIKKTLKNQE